MKNNSVQKVYLDGMFAGVFTKSGLHIWGGPFFKIDISGHGTASVYETELPASSLQPLYSCAGVQEEQSNTQ